jgi:hypothetical protein
MLAIPKNQISAFYHDCSCNFSDVSTYMVLLFCYCCTLSFTVNREITLDSFCIARHWEAKLTGKLYDLHCNISPCASFRHKDTSFSCSASVYPKSMSIATNQLTFSTTFLIKMAVAIAANATTTSAQDITTVQFMF